MAEKKDKMRQEMDMSMKYKSVMTEAERADTERNR
jgi:hypothetical protein